MKIKKGDTVVVLTGKDRGKTGKVTRAIPREGHVLVEGVNVRTRHQKARRSGEKGQILQKTMPLRVSNVALIDPETKKPTRVGYRFEGEKKLRVARKSGSALD